MKNWFNSLAFRGRLTIIAAIVVCAALVLIAALLADGTYTSTGCAIGSVAIDVHSEPFVHRPSGLQTCTRLGLSSDFPSVLLALTSLISIGMRFVLFSHFQTLPRALAADGLLPADAVPAIDGAITARRATNAPFTCGFSEHASGWRTKTRVWFHSSALTQLASQSRQAYNTEQPPPTDAAQAQTQRRFRIFAQDRVNPGPTPDNRRWGLRTTHQLSEGVIAHFDEMTQPVSAREQIELAFFALGLSILFYTVPAHRYYQGTTWWASWDRPYFAPTVWIAVGAIGTYSGLVQFIGFSRVKRALEAVSVHSLTTRDSFRFQIPDDLGLARRAWRSIGIMLRMKSIGFLLFFPAFYAATLILRTVQFYYAWVAVILVAVLFYSINQFSIARSTTRWHEAEVARLISETRDYLHAIMNESRWYEWPNRELEFQVVQGDLATLLQIHLAPRSRWRFLASATSSALALVIGAATALVPLLVPS